MNDDKVASISLHANRDVCVFLFWVKIPLYGLRVLVVQFSVAADFRLKCRDGIEIATPYNAAIQAAEQSFNPVSAANNTSAYTHPECDAFYLPKNVYASLWISTCRS
ncbi:MAG: hypothetical protein LBJ67_00345 [Planctomycetaceae bacterium]|jgi:hypothetical protein|nr:hypothetical protein [Planctomycetaceae bacterium]